MSSCSDASPTFRCFFVSSLRHVLCASLSAWYALSTGLAANVDLTRAFVVVPPSLNRQEQKAAQMLIEEVEKRTQIRLPRDTKAPSDGTPSISINRIAAPPPNGREGYRIAVEGNSVSITGNDARGVLFGVGACFAAAHGEAIPVTSRQPQRHHRSQVRTARPSAWLSAEDQFLRRLGRRPCGSSTSATWRSSAQRDRADSAALGR